MQGHYGTVALLINEHKQILLTKRSNYTRNFPHHWTLPGGGKEEGEIPELTITREVKEELGLDFVPTKIFWDYPVEHNGMKSHAYRFLGNFSGKISLQEEEADGYGWFSYQEAMELPLAFDYREVLEKLYKDNFIF